MKEESGSKINELEKRLEELEWDNKPHFDRCEGFRAACSGGAVLSIQPYRRDEYYIKNDPTSYGGVHVITHCPFCGEELRSGK